MLSIHTIVNKPVPSNCFVLYDKSVGQDCVVIDPGSKSDSDLFAFLEEEGLVPEYIVLTHEHFDHCWGVNALRRDYPSVKLICSSACSEAIQSAKKNYSVFYQQPGFEVAAADILIENLSSEFNWKGYQLSFFSAKGHSLSGVLILIDKYLFTGGSLIKDVKTVTKLKTGSKEEQYKTIQLLYNMKEQGYLVYPGHGDVFGLDDYNLERSLV